MTHIVVFHVLSDGARQRVLAAISTNLADMTWTAPFRLVASALVVDTSGTILDQVLIVGLGIGICLSTLEHRLGSFRAFGAIGAIGAVTWLLPKWLRIPWGAVVVLYPLTAASWFGWLPDYSSVGHVLSGAIGVYISQNRSPVC